MQVMLRSPVSPVMASGSLQRAFEQGSMGPTVRQPRRPSSTSRESQGCYNSLLALTSCVPWAPTHLDLGTTQPDSLQHMGEERVQSEALTAVMTPIHTPGVEAQALPTPWLLTPFSWQLL